MKAPIPDAGWDNPAPVEEIEIGLWDWPNWLKKMMKVIKRWRYTYAR